MPYATWFKAAGLRNQAPVTKAYGQGKDAYSANILGLEDFCYLLGK